MKIIVNLIVFLSLANTAFACASDGFDPFADVARLHEEYPETKIITNLSETERRDILVTVFSSMPNCILTSQSEDDFESKLSEELLKRTGVSIQDAPMVSHYYYEILIYELENMHESGEVLASETAGEIEIQLEDCSNESS